LSADVGGTFTDIAVYDEATGSLRLGKTLTTPRRLVNGIATGVGKAGSSFAEAQLFLHGTTVAINTILERSGARAILLTTQGFRDIYEIGRVNRPESYNLFFQKHVPLIERSRRYEIRERMDAEGRALIPVDEDQVRAIVAEAVKDGIEAVAILFLHSYRNPAHERRVKQIIARPNTRSFLSPPRTNCRRNTGSSSALRPLRPTPISARACGVISERCRDICARPASPAIFSSCSPPADCSIRPMRSAPASACWSRDPLPA
jgi:N-methylhydantoinase A